jgi:hypothetical protein
MNLFELKRALADAGEAVVRFRLPDGSLVAPHAHITEAGLVTKSFVDCGGTARFERKCQLQSWVAEDIDHRLSASKLFSIIEKGKAILGPEDLPVELEHDIGYATQFQVVSAEIQEGDLVIQVVGRHTACLAPEKCCPEPQTSGVVSLGRKNK